jgi:Glycosyltransferase family 87
MDRQRGLVAHVLRSFAGMKQGAQSAVREVRIAVAATIVALALILCLEAISGEAVRYDFSTIYLSGWMLSHANPSKLYDIDEQTRAQQAVFRRSDALPVNHPAFEAALFAPLARLSYPVAYVLWGFINILLWLWFVRSVRVFIKVPQRPFQYLILCFGFFPLWVAFLHGGTSVALLFVYGLVYCQMKRGRDFSAGAILGLGLFRFHLVLPFVAVFAVRQKWRFLYGFITTAVALVLISLVTVGGAGMMEYVQFLIGMLTNPRHEMNSIVPPSIMATLRAFLISLLQGYLSTMWINSISVVVSVLLILLSGYCWIRDDRNGGTHSDLLFAAAIGSSIITGVYSLIHDLSLMLLAILLVTGFATRHESTTVYRVLSGCLLLLYILPCLLLLVSRGRGLYVLCPVIIVFVATILYISRQRPVLGLSTPLESGTRNQALPDLSLLV